MNEIRYLNVDCILRSETSLSGLLEALKDDIFTLWNEPLNHGSFVGFETNLVNTAGPDEDIAEFLRLFEANSLIPLLNECQEKVFDIGFESGDVGDPLDFIIDSKNLKKITDLGFTIKMRIYPLPPIEKE